MEIPCATLDDDAGGAAPLLSVLLLISWYECRVSANADTGESRHAGLKIL
jgi:hypothetical protein